MFAKSAIVAAALFAGISSASAQDLDFSKISCKDFLAAPKDQIAIVLVWLEGYYTKESDPPILRDEKTQKDAKALGVYCGTNPDHDIIRAAEKVMPVK